VIAERLFERGDMPVYYVGNKRSPLADDPRFAARATTIEAATELAKLVREIVIDEESTSRVAVIIEQLGDFLQSPADAPLVDLVRAIKREDHFAVAEAESSSWVTSWPLFGEFKSARRGLLLQPDSTDGDVILKTTLPRLKRSEFPVGRGMLVSSGAATRVQLALADGVEPTESQVGSAKARGL
jgi:S-DNA-T family DNA segregation ATPase FtsK/SpoIIIE